MFTLPIVYRTENYNKRLAVRRAGTAGKACTGFVARISIGRSGKGFY